MLLVMAALAPNPIWWMIAAVGAGMNGVAVASNGWLMPVRGLTERSIRHEPMHKFTRYKWLCDVIPTGLGKASVGDFILCAGVLGAWATRWHFSYPAIACMMGLAWWSCGSAGGFRLFEKWPKEARKDARKNIPIVLVLMTIGNFLNVRGCSIAQMNASTLDIQQAMNPRRAVIKHDAVAHLRSLGSIAPPPFQILTRLRMEEAKRMAEMKRAEDLRLKGEAVRAILNVPPPDWVQISRKMTREGPYCHVQCSVHHGAVYDRETLPEICRANWIPPQTERVPGWYPIEGTDQEITAMWPGPATPGFSSYKLYWKDKQ